MFTLDTYLTADRRTNVQLSWRQLDNERSHSSPES